jgi:hypothetical protein
MNHNIKIDQELWAKAKAQAALQGITLTKYITQLIKSDVGGLKSN